jgi:hypothetical protein
MSPKMSWWQQQQHQQQQEEEEKEKEEEEEEKERVGTRHAGTWSRDFGQEQKN